MTRVGVTGHQVLPPQAVALVQERLPSIFRRLHATEVVGSLAKGADQLCAAIALELGIAIRVIVPSQGYSTTFDKEGLETYERLRREATSVVTLEYADPSEEAFNAAGRQVVDECEVLLAVWDGLSASGLGGTGDIVAYARSKGTSVTVLWPRGVQR